ncbi:hypothetical protein FGG08_006331 [Glutinoglossum americanum]|uniref:DUF7099 domain-containing protein n=1 Tax=Glutinoglossum americanum TaxID=1670608 RepID=A0A9P8I7L5_9PEZI|nr:hypothetical protein FGG08_006331 [Glutinoglossum americanum]
MILDVCASLFNLLSTRRDIDNLTLEILGRYNVDRLTGSPLPDYTDRLDFSLACQLEFIFDLQRAHLQSRTPFSSWDSSGLTERLPYLISLQTAKGAFGCLSRLAEGFIARFGGGQEGEISSKRNVFVRALVSGTRMLCLHPGVTSGEMIKPFLGNDFSFWEQILMRTCDVALSRVPRVHPTLRLPRLDGKTPPIDDSGLLRVATECAADFLNDTSFKYWTLYDISCSVVAAYIQHRAAAEDAVSEDAIFDDHTSEDAAGGDDASETAKLLGTLAAKIADNAIAEALRVYGMSGGGERSAVLLMDIIEVLNPILVVHPNLSCQVGYEELLGHPRYRDHSPTQSQNIHKMSALKQFQKTLKQRESVLRDSNEELPMLLSDIERVCSDIADAYIGPSSKHASYVVENHKHIGPASPRSFPEDSRSIQTLKLYATNCESTHIIADGPKVAQMLRDAEEQRSRWVLGLANRKWQELDELRRSRETSFMLGVSAGGAGVPWAPIGGHAPEETFLSKGSQPTYSPSSRGHNRESTLSSGPPVSEYRAPEYRAPDQFPEHAGSEVGSQLTTSASLHWGGFKKIIRVGKKPPGTFSDTPLRTPLHRLFQGGAEVNVTLSANCERLITWTNKSLGLYEISEQGETRELMVTPLSEKDQPHMILASVTYCVIVHKGPNSDEASSQLSIGYRSESVQADMREQIVFYELSQQFRRMTAYKTQEPIQSLALSPDDTHLAVGFTNETIQLLRLNRLSRQTTVTVSNLPLRTSSRTSPRSSPPIVSLSFSVDKTQLAAAARDGTVVSAFTSVMPFTSRKGPYIDESIGVRGDDDQGVSFVICCPGRSLLCVTYWTRSGIPLLIDCAAKKSQRLNKPTTRLDIGTRIQQAAFSKSGSILVLINSAGNIFKISTDDIDHIKAEAIGRSRWVPRVVGKSQPLEMRISDDERNLKVVFTKDNYIHITNYRLQL